MTHTIKLNSRSRLTPGERLRKELLNLSPSALILGAAFVAYVIAVGGM